ncbi:DNA cross-link repair 1A protein isoform 4-T4 [Alca torda]
MSEDALLEEDIWEYKSIRKQKHQSNSESISTPAQKVSDDKDRPKRKRNRNKKKSVEKTDKLQKTEQSSRPNQDADQSKDDSSVHSQESVSSLTEQSSQSAKPVHDGYCPSCQMPFALLLVQTPRWHVTECLDTPGSIEKECPDGLLCTSTIPSHYKRYSHFLLAASRAGDYLVSSSTNTLERKMTYCTAAKPSCSPSHVEETSQNEKPSNNVKNVPNDDCTLMVQSSPQMKSLNTVSESTSSFADVQKPEKTCQLTQTTDNSCEFEFYDFASSQESRIGEDLCSQKDASQPSLLQAKADFSDCEISYSPLSTFEESEEETEEEENKVKMSQNKLFKVQNCEDEESNSVGFKTFDGLFLQWKPQYEHTKTGNFIVKKTHSSMNTKSSSAKELKQMDIGVFFGLKPKVKEESKGETRLSEGKQIPSSVTPGGKRPRQQKRKAEGSVEDVEAVTESSSKNGALADVSSGGQQRWRKKFKELSTTGEGTGKKHCPFYKKIPGTGFTVDAFQYGEIEGCTAYFLTHFHSDHYCGLTKNFMFPIYCNKITGNLVKSKLRVKEEYIHVLPMDTECIVNGIKVLLLDANHCPGATMILFYLPSGTVILHTGDFRADPSMERYPALIGQQVHTLYLDTTYCSPEYTFPSQQEVIQFAVNTAFETVTLNPRTLVVCGTYSIGKEKVFLAIAEVLGSKASMSRDKYKTLQCLESATVNSLISMDWDGTLLHVLPMMQINFKGLQDHLNKFSENFDQVLAFKPTGWTYSDSCLSLLDIKPQTRGKITIYGIPYSEHSSYLEMKRFVQWLKPQKIIPTVNIGDWRARSLMEKHFRDWMIEGSRHK